MGISDQMNNLAGQMKTGIQSTSLKMTCLVLRIITGLLLGLTLGLIFQELIHYGTFSLIFVMAMALLVFFRVSKDWGLPQILIFDLICILTAQLLRMYILVAPGG
ncbi:MAG: hypothetical protein V4736_07870 [Bdellovibrionota bacterium]